MEIRISAKDLGALNMPDFCPRCFWIKRHVKKLPFQIFPGIFSSIGSYTKKVVHHAFDTTGRAPAFMPALADAVKYLKAPHWKKFCRTDPVTGITVSGVVDDLLETADGWHIIPDYKTARHTAGQDKLLPLYTGQLNAYAWIDRGFDHQIHSLPLIYCEPVTDQPGGFYTDVGFDMPFIPKTVQVERNPDLVPKLLAKAAEILAMDKPPAGTDGCKDCAAVDDMIGRLAA